MRPDGRNQLPNRARIRTRNLKIGSGSRNIGTANLSIETGSNRKLESGNRNIETGNRRIPITANGNPSLGNGNTMTIRSVSGCISPIAIKTSSENTSATTATIVTTARLPPGLEKQLRRNGSLPPGLQRRAEPFPVIWNAAWDRCPADIRG